MQVGMEWDVGVGCLRELEDNVINKMFFNVYSIPKKGRIIFRLKEKGE